MRLSHFNETLHSIRQGLLFPLPAKAERPRREREPSPYPYPDLEPSQRAFRVARRNKAIELARAAGRPDLVERLQR